MHLKAMETVRTAGPSTDHRFHADSSQLKIQPRSRGELSIEITGFKEEEMQVEC